MEETKQELTMDFPAIEEYLTYYILDAYKYVLPYAEGNKKKKLKKMRYTTIFALLLQIVACMLPIAYWIWGVHKWGVRAIWEISLLRYACLFTIALVVLGFIPIITYKSDTRKRLRRILERNMEKDSKLKRIGSISFTENGIEVTMSEEENLPMKMILIPYTVCKKIGIHRHVITVEMDNGKEKEILLIPKMMAKDKQQWKKIKQFLRSLHKREAIKDIN